MAASANVSHEQARIIPNNNGFKYKKYQRRIKVMEEIKKQRMEFAQKMKEFEHDWGFTIFTDECSFWLHKSRLSKKWGSNDMDIESLGSHGPKLHL